MHRQRAEHDGAGRHDQAEQHHGDGAGGAFERRRPAALRLASAGARATGLLARVSRRARPSQCSGRQTSKLMAANISSVGAPAVGAR